MTPRLLEWDTEFWGFRVGQSESVDEWWARSHVDVMCLLLPTDDNDQIRWAEEEGYRLTDVRVTLTKRAVDLRCVVRQAVEADLNWLEAIARTAHRATRFYADPSFPNARCHDLYETWLRNSYVGYADRVFVAEASATPAGYITVHHGVDQVASIGLIAVVEDARGQGLGTALVEAAIGYGFRVGATEIRVVTQGRNVAAQRLFQACGFRTTSTSLWFHKDFR